MVSTTCRFREQRWHAGGRGLLYGAGCGRMPRGVRATSLDERGLPGRELSVCTSARVWSGRSRGRAGSWPALPGRWTSGPGRLARPRRQLPAGAPLLPEVATAATITPGTTTMTIKAASTSNATPLIIKRRTAAPRKNGGGERSGHARADGRVPHGMGRGARFCARAGWRGGAAAAGSAGMSAVRRPTPRTSATRTPGPPGDPARPCPAGPANASLSVSITCSRSAWDARYRRGPGRARLPSHPQAQSRWHLPTQHDEGSVTPVVLRWLSPQRLDRVFGGCGGVCAPAGGCSPDHACAHVAQRVSVCDACRDAGANYPAPPLRIGAMPTSGRHYARIACIDQAKRGFVALGGARSFG